VDAALDLHEAFAWVVVIANGLAGLWALTAHWVPAARVGALWWFTGAAQVTIFVQVAIGAYLVAGEDIEAPEFHMFYGFIALVAVAIIYSYRRQLDPHRYLLYGCGELFVMGLAIRAMFLA
jgi:hypothetical protein